MPTNQSKTAQPVKDYDLRPEWKIFIPTIIIILLISIPAVVAPKSTEEFFKALYNPLAFNFWHAVSLDNGYPHLHVLLFCPEPLGEHQIRQEG